MDARRSAGDAAWPEGSRCSGGDAQGSGGQTKQLYGALDRPYGEVSRFHIGDVNLPANGGFGNTGVFRTITWGPMKNGERTPNAGETWVSMVEFGTPMKAVGVMSYGNSSQPGSKH